MTTMTFDERIQRISSNHAAMHPVQTPQKKWGRQRVPTAGSTGGVGFLKKPFSISLGLVAGVAEGMLLAGLTAEVSPWGPGTALGEIISIPVLGLFALAPLMVFVSLFMRKKSPGFFLFSVTYIAAILTTILI
jgi:hypothetical protein